MVELDPVPTVVLDKYGSPGTHRRASIVVGVVLNQTHGMNLRSAPSIPIDTVANGGVFKWGGVQLLVRPSSQRNTNDDHIKRDGDDRRNLAHWQ